MVQLQKYYKEKCSENDQYKKICNEYETMINKCKLEYRELQEKYEEASSKLKGSGALSKKSDDSEMPLKSKVEDLERKLKRVN